MNLSKLKRLVHDVFCDTSLQEKQLDFLQNYSFPEYIIDRYRKDYDIGEEDAKQVVRHFLFYFSLFTSYENRICAMPSQKVDDLWHTFLLFTPEYHYFCKKAFWRFVHHRPDSSMPEMDKKQQIRNTYYGLEFLQKEFKIFSELDHESIFQLDKRLSGNG